MYNYNLASQFKHIVNQYGSKEALIYEDRNYSFLELSKRANYFSLFLQAKNITIGDVLCIINNKEFDSYAMMIACLMNGVAYVNIDPENPEDRVNKIINRCQPKAIFTDNQGEQFKALSLSLGVYYFDGSIHFEQGKKSFEETPKIDGNTIAYIMFTSGSTGEPKGVAITHQNVIHFIHWIKDRYKILPQDNFANLSPMYFDNSVFDFYGGFFNGASLTPIKKELFESPLKLIKYIEEKNCTIWFSVPSLLIFLINMKVLREGILKSIRVFTFGGEGFPKSILKKLYENFNKTAKIINVYGPTEGTCICSSYDITEAEFHDLSELPSLGKMNPNFSYLIEGEDGNMNEGELIIIGPNVAAGYYRFPEKTNESFGVFEEGKFYLNRYYRTGDIVKKENGLLYFKGRKDNQIKHMGYRVELEEVELSINKLEGVMEAAVIYQRLNDSYGKIIAFIVSEKIKEEKEIKQLLEKFLPTYMLPNKIQFMEVLPKNANGKIDRVYLKNNY